MNKLYIYNDNDYLKSIMIVNNNNNRKKFHGLYIIL